MVLIRVSVLASNVAVSAFILLAAIFFTVQGGDFPTNELDALESLYYSTEGPFWTYDNATGLNNQSVWDFSNPDANPCIDNWSGLICNTDCLVDPDIECHIETMRLTNYNMVGAVSEELAAFPSLVAVTMSQNSLKGSIPAYLGDLTKLQLLSLGYNEIEGSIPSSICSLCGANLISLLLGHNFLSQSMPYCIVNSNSSLRVLDLSSNLLDGVLLTESPADIYDLYIHSRGRNDFVHSIQWFDLSDNFFSGVIPLVINQWTSMQLFNISYNKVHGPMVLSANLSTLVGYDVSGNYLTGKLPTDLARMTNLYSLSAGDNLLSGPLPFDDEKLLPLTNYSFYTMDLSANFISGSLPSGMGNFLILNTLLLSSNDLSGPLSGVFRPEQNNLNVLDFNSNDFTGTIPEDIWQLPYIGSVSMAKNCLHGSIPSGICQARYLQTLDLDGVSASETCRRSSQALNELSHQLETAPIYNTKYIDGGIPSCILQSLPYLNSLYLSGNGLSCTIPEIAQNVDGDNFNTSLSVLTLSNNRLYGAIPLSLQMSRDIQYLDLSHNRLSGTIERMNYTYTMVEMNTPNANTNKHYLGLKANRLSGPLPPFMRDVNMEINVLAGNMFDCNFDAIPRQDEDYNHYWCGSLQLTTSWFNIVTVVSVSFMFIALVSLAIRRCRCCFGEGSNGFDDDDKTLFEATGSTTCWSFVSTVVGALFETVPATVVRVARKLLQFPPNNNATAATPGNSEVFGDLSAGGSSATGAIGQGAESKYDTGKIHRDIVNVLYLFVYMRRFSLFMVAVGFAVMLPAYVLIKTSNSNSDGDGSTHTYQYGWLPSLAYIGGTSEGVAVLVLWSLLMVLIAALCLVMEKARVDKGLLSTGSLASTPVISSISAALTTLSTSDQVYYVIVKFYLLFFIVVNCVVMVIVNGLYVFVNVTQSPLYGAISLYCLVIFKSFWNVKVVPAMLMSRPSSWTTYWTRCKSLLTMDSVCSCLCCCCCCSCCGLQQRCCPRKENTQSHYTDLYAVSKQSLRGRTIRSATTQCMLLVFNNVLAPAIAVFFSDSSCISQLFLPPAAIQSSFTYPKCVEFEFTGDHSVVCTSLEGATVATDFKPPFVYSYQCGSALLTNYVPVYLLMYGVGGILIPCIQWLVVILLQHHWYRQMCVTVGRRLSLDGLPSLKALIRQTGTKSMGEDELEAAVSAGNKPSGTIGAGEDNDDEVVGKRQESASLLGTMGARGATMVGSKASLFRMSSQHSDSMDMLREVPGEDYQSSQGNDRDSDSDSGEFVLRGSDISNFSEMEELEKRHAEARNKKVQRQQSLAVVLTLGMISAMHWPILACPDMTCLSNPKDSNNRYRIQNTTCSCIAGIGVLLSFGMAYPPLGLVVAVFVCTQTYLLQSIITAHLNTCAEHQELAHMQMLNHQTQMQASDRKEHGHADAIQQVLASSRQQATATGGAGSSNSSIVSSGSSAATPGLLTAAVSSVASAATAPASAAGGGGSVSTQNTAGGGRSINSMSNRSELNRLHIRYENNWYVALTAILRKECQGLSSLLYKCSLWMTVFCGLFAALFLFDISMVPGLSLIIVIIAAALTGLIVSCRSWYKEYSFLRRQKRELKHASYEQYRESRVGALDEHSDGACTVLCDYLHYCLINYVYYYLFCGCLYPPEGPTIDEMMAAEEEAALDKNRSLAPLLGSSSLASGAESGRSSYRDSNASSMSATSAVCHGASLGPPSGVLRTHTEHSETSEADSKQV